MAFWSTKKALISEYKNIIFYEILIFFLSRLASRALPNCVYFLAQKLNNPKSVNKNIRVMLTIRLGLTETVSV